MHRKISTQYNKNNDIFFLASIRPWKLWMWIESYAVVTIVVFICFTVPNRQVSSVEPVFKSSDNISSSQYINLLNHLLSIKDECTFIFLNFLMIGLCNSSANSLLEIISFLTVPPEICLI